MTRLTLTTPGVEQNTMDMIYKTMVGRMEASPSGLCPIDLTLSFVQMCHSQSCGKCVPCRIGLGQLAQMLETILEGEGDENSLKLLEKTANSIYLSADCVIGYSAAQMVLTGIQDFKKDYQAHIMKHKCLGYLDESVPCTANCPAHVDIPGYISLVADECYDDAVQLIRKDNPFPTACAFVCNHRCEISCRRNMVDEAINIRGLKRYAVDKGGAMPAPKNLPSTGKRIAVIGGGPSGMTAAYYLQLMGHEVTVLERRAALGGMLRYGIPSYRLPRERLDEDIKHILSTGVQVRYEASLGKEIPLKELQAEYDAVYLAIGAHGDKKLGIDGEDAIGVTSAVELLRSLGKGVKPDFQGKTVVVVGGGNVAMDVARSSIRLGASKVYIAYRRTKKQMTALPDEVEGAIAEGCQLLELYAPQSIKKNAEGQVEALCLQPQIIGAIDKSGRPRPSDAPEAVVELKCDIIVAAIGQNIEWEELSAQGVTVERGRIKATGSGAVLNMPGIFAGGDCVDGPDTVIRSIAAGKVAAANIDAYLGYAHQLDFGVRAAAPHFVDRLPCGRCNNREREAAERRADFDMVELNMTPAEAKQEALRCLGCNKFGLGALKGGAKTW